MRASRVLVAVTAMSLGFLPGAVSAQEPAVELVLVNPDGAYPGGGIAFEGSATDPACAESLVMLTVTFPDANPQDWPAGATTADGAFATKLSIEPDVNAGEASAVATVACDTGEQSALLSFRITDAPTSVEPPDDGVIIDPCAPDGSTGSGDEPVDGGVSIEPVPGDGTVDPGDGGTTEPDAGDGTDGSAGDGEVPAPGETETDPGSEPVEDPVDGEDPKVCYSTSAPGAGEDNGAAETGGVTDGSVAPTAVRRNVPAAKPATPLVRRASFTG